MTQADPTPAEHPQTPTYEAMKAEAQRRCACGERVTHANRAPQRGFGNDAADYVCCDSRTETGMLHPGECCLCFDRRTPRWTVIAANARETLERHGIPVEVEA